MHVRCHGARGYDPMSPADSTNAPGSRHVAGRFAPNGSESGDAAKNGCVPDPVI